MTLSETTVPEAADTGRFKLCGSMPPMETDFHPKYQLDGLSGNGSGDSDTLDSFAVDSAETDRLLADAYAKGVKEGHLAGLAENHQSQAGRDALAIAMANLTVADNEQLTRLVWQSLLGLFREALGDVCCDEALLLQRCREAVDTIDAKTGDPQLHVATADAEILKSADWDIEIVADSDLLPGSIRLIYPAGETISGSLAIIHKLEDKVDADGGSKC